MPRGNLLNRDHLDKAFPANPIVVGHVSMHGAVLNSIALKRYGTGRLQDAHLVALWSGSREPASPMG